jgi:hypothetical protein
VEPIQALAQVVQFLEDVEREIPMAPMVANPGNSVELTSRPRAAPQNSASAAGLAQSNVTACGSTKEPSLMIVVTGATGQLGSRIVERLLERVPLETALQTTIAE